MAEQKVGRLAPSPTGAQHLGNARTFLIAWLSVRQAGGHLILRMEDIDSPRIKPWAAAQAIEDLRWLGLDWDESSDRPRGDRKYVQSERLAIYLAALEKLRASEAVYPCTCSRSDIEEAASAPHEISDGPIYGGTCCHRSASDAMRLDQHFAWRFRAIDEEVSFEDAVHGRLAANVRRDLGDFVVYKSDGSPAYQLSVVVDDHEMGITEIVRGDDLIPSTFRQLNLYRFFGWAAPRFGHVPLVIGPDGRRLAKRHGDTRLSHFRSVGVRAERIIGLLAHSLGWLPRADEISARELIDVADLTRIPKQPWVFDERSLAWLEQLST